MKYVNKATIGVLVVGLRQKKKKKILCNITASELSHSNCGRFVIGNCGKYVFGAPDKVVAQGTVPNPVGTRTM